MNPPLLGFLNHAQTMPVYVVGKQQAVLSILHKPVMKTGRTAGIVPTGNVLVEALHQVFPVPVMKPPETIRVTAIPRNIPVLMAPVVISNVIVGKHIIYKVGHVKVLLN